VHRSIPLAATLLGASLAACTGSRAGATGTSAAPGPRIASAPTQAASPATTAAFACALRPACDAPLPPVATRRPFAHNRSSLIVAAGDPRHRGRDLFLLPGSAPWVIGKFAYGPTDKDLEDEDVDVWLLRDCGPNWEKVGTFRTTATEGAHPPVLGVADRGGQIFVDLSKTALPTGPLGAGRHRIRMIVVGDGSGADLYLEILKPGARIAVSDIDGTLTEREDAVVGDVLGGSHAEAHPGAAEAMKALAGRGYHLFYLTARPDWLVPRTREWLALRGFPPGILHTTTTATGVMGEAAAAFKSAELDALKKATGLVPALAFGNMPSDVATYANAGISPGRTYYYKLEADPRGGVRHDDYRGLLPAVSTLPAMCP
jgi:hypothetical protein